MEQLCTTLGIQRPVLAAPMAAISGGRLAAAVTAAGGLGMIGAGYGDLDWLASQARLVTASRFGIGVITWSMGERTLDAVLALHPDAVWLSFGDPYEHVGVIHDADTIAICQVGAIEEAAEVAAAGADVIVAQGKEAGGHGRLTMPVLELVGATAPVVAPIPVVAAGGHLGQGRPRYCPCSRRCRRGAGNGALWDLRGSRHRCCETAPRGGGLDRYDREHRL